MNKYVLILYVFYFSYYFLLFTGILKQENYLQFIIKIFVFNHLSRNKYNYNINKKLFIITIMINYIN